MSSIESVYENSEPQDGFSDLGSTDASGSSGPNKRKRQHCAPAAVGRRRNTEPHPAAQCEWSTDHTLRLLSKKVEALLIENSTLRKRLHANGLRVDDTSQPSYEVTRLESSAKLLCKPCQTQFLRVAGLLRHIRESHPELAPYIDQKNCVQYDLKFERTSDLVRHEKFYHQESYTIRIELFGELERFDELIKEESCEWA
ncbi:MAG: hypothetical protein M1839_005392 [Geoglossum umbratile]|nr:MAG: hypothetical protein M1839_005392 [Geoglossum umbratile]